MFISLNNLSAVFGQHFSINTLATIQFKYAHAARQLAARSRVYRPNTYADKCVCLRGRAVVHADARVLASLGL